MAWRGAWRGHPVTLRLFTPCAAESSEEALAGFAREVADRVMFFDQGRIAHDAPPQEFFSNPANDRIRAFLGQVSH